MATIATLLVGLKANTAGFDKGMKRSSARVVTFSSVVGNAGRRLLKFASIAAAAGGAALAFGLKRAATEMDTLAKTSKKLGVSTEQLGALRHAAELSGVAIQTLDMGLQRMVRRVSEAAKGTGEAQAAIAELGIDIHRLASLTPDKQFMAIADAMESVENQADRVRLSFKLFDSEGVALVNTLRGGGDAIKKARSELDRLNATVSAIDAAKAEQFNDAITRLKATLGGVFSSTVAKVAGSLQIMADTFARGIGFISSWRRELVSLGTALIAIKAALVFQNLILPTVIGFWKLYATALKSAGIASILFDAIAGGGVVAAARMKVLLISLAAAGVAVVAVTVALDKMEESAANAEIRINQETIAALKEARADNQQAAKDSLPSDGAALATKSVQGLLEAYQRTTREIGMTSDELFRAELAQKGMTDALREFNLLAQERGQSERQQEGEEILANLEKQFDAIGKTEGALLQAKLQALGMNETVRETARILSDAIEKRQAMFDVEEKMTSSSSAPSGVQAREIKTALSIASTQNANPMVRGIDGVNKKLAAGNRDLKELKREQARTAQAIETLVNNLEVAAA